MLDDATMRELRTAADMQGLRQEFAELEALAQPAVPEPVAALMRSRYVMTPARIAHDMKDHFSDWGDWVPTTYSHAKAVTDPARNTDPLLYEMRPLYARPAQPPREPLSDEQIIRLMPQYPPSGKKMIAFARAVLAAAQEKP
jgi:hypothetical protein